MTDKQLERLIRLVRYGVPSDTEKEVAILLQDNIFETGSVYMIDDDDN